jgi:hypothetical protein
MHSRFRTCRALAWPSDVRLIHEPATVLLTIILLGSSAFPQSDSERLGMSANELARRVVTNELKFQAEDHGHWMYRLQKEENGKKRSCKSSRQKTALSAGSSPLMAVPLTRNRSRKRTSACRGS